MQKAREGLMQLAGRKTKSEVGNKRFLSPGAFANQISSQMAVLSSPGAAKTLWLISSSQHCFHFSTRVFPQQRRRRNSQFAISTGGSYVRAGDSVGTDGRTTF